MEKPPTEKIPDLYMLNGTPLAECSKEDLINALIDTHQQLISQKELHHLSINIMESIIEAVKK